MVEKVILLHVGGSDFVPLRDYEPVYPRDVWNSLVEGDQHRFNGGSGQYLLIGRLGTHRQITDKHDGAVCPLVFGWTA